LEAIAIASADQLTEPDDARSQLPFRFSIAGADRRTPCPPHKPFHRHEVFEETEQHVRRKKPTYDEACPDALQSSVYHGIKKTD
jgi:hypothetical protein